MKLLEVLKHQKFWCKINKQRISEMAWMLPRVLDVFIFELFLCSNISPSNFQRFWKPNVFAPAELIYIVEKNFGKSVLTIQMKIPAISRRE